MSYSLDPTYSFRCQPYKCPVAYPSKETCYSPEKDISDNNPRCIPFGYAPKRHNPGGLKFYMYDYTVQTTGDRPLTHPGKGWYTYERTGVYPWFKNWDY